MSSVVRTLWVSQLVLGAPFLLYLGLMAAGAPSRWTVGPLVGWAVVAALAVAATARLAQAFVRGDQGEVLVQGGGRIPLEVWRAVARAENAELAIGVLAGAIGTAGAARAGHGALMIVPVIALAVLGAMLYLGRRRSRGVTESFAAIMDGELDRAEQLLRPASRVPALVEHVRNLHAEIELRRGRPNAALRLLEHDWKGVLDQRAGQIALLRLGRGELELAERWLGASRDDTRYDQFLGALVGARLALHQGQWEEARALATTPIDLPPFYARPLGLTEAAALQGAGRTSEARDRLVELGGIGADGWLSEAEPLLFGLLTDADASRPTTRLVESAARSSLAVPGPERDPGDRGNPYAPPTTPQAAALQYPGIGVIPVESIPVASRQRPVLRGALGLLLLGLGGPLGLLGAFVWAVGDVDPYAMVLGVGTAATGGLMLVEQLVMARARGPAMTLSDGRRIPAAGYAVWLVTAVAPVALLGVIGVLMSAVVSEATGRTSWVGGWTLPFAALLGWSAYGRWQLMRVARSVHFDPPEVAVERAARRRSRLLPQGIRAAQWTALARLWSGDAIGAERELADGAVGALGQDGLQGWFRAGRGELDLERVLAEPEPLSLGERYRWAVTVALAALQAGQPERVCGRTAGWNEVADQLPNRFGALLRHLARKVAGQAEQGRDPELAWLDSVWPFAA